jgi:exosortase E/protease (VPEID-CTERM system)
MHASSSSTPWAVAGGPWRAAALLAVLLAGESAVVAWCFGDWLWVVEGKRWAGFAVLLVLGGLRSHVARHRDEYRDAPVLWPAVVGQVVSFAGGLAALGWLADEVSANRPSSVGSLLTTAVAAVAWLVCSLLLIAPRPRLFGQLFGTATLLAAFAVTAWNAGDLTSSFWHASSGTTMRLVELLLGPVADGPVVRPATYTIGTDTFQVNVSPACSGFHGIGLVTTLLAGYLWWFRRGLRFPQALLLVPVGAAVMWLANVLRITAIVLVGIWISPAIAVDGFHSVAGWIAFLSVGLGLIWVTSRMKFFTQPEALAAAEAGPDLPPPAATAALDATAPSAGSGATTRPLSAATCILPFLVLTAVTMLTHAFTSGFDLLYPVRVIATAGVLVALRRELPWRTARVCPVAVAIGAVAFAIWMLLAPGAEAASASATARQDPGHLGQPWQALWLLFRLAGSTLTVPIAEELFFRGFVTRRCIDADVDRVPVGAFSWFSFLVSSVSFGLLHGDAWLAGIVAGMLFAAALSRRRRIADAVVAHAATNALLSGYVIATGSWAQWG